MPARQFEVPMSQVPTTDQLRSAIDSGATGEKVGFPDPAAAPLGTDAEAGGAAPTVAERKMAAASQPRVRREMPLNGPVIYLCVFLVIAALVLLIVLNS